MSLPSELLNPLLHKWVCYAIEDLGMREEMPNEEYWQAIANQSKGINILLHVNRPKSPESGPGGVYALLAFGNTWHAKILACVNFWNPIDNEWKEKEVKEAREKLYQTCREAVLEKRG